jgi:hypothetical protein
VWLLPGNATNYRAGTMFWMSVVRNPVVLAQIPLKIKVVE